MLTSADALFPRPSLDTFSTSRSAGARATLLSLSCLLFRFPHPSALSAPPPAGPTVSRHQNVLPLKSGGSPPPTPFPAAFVAPTASVLGAVTATPSASVWYGATVRGDVAPVSLADRSAVMDGAIVGGGARVGAGAVVGAAAVVGDGAVLGEGAVVGAGAVLGEGVVVEANGVVDAGTFFRGGRGGGAGGREALCWCGTLRRRRPPGCTACVRARGGGCGRGGRPPAVTPAHQTATRRARPVSRIFVGDLPRPGRQALQSLL